MGSYQADTESVDAPPESVAGRVDLHSLARDAVVDRNLAFLGHLVSVVEQDLAKPPQSMSVVRQPGPVVYQKRSD